MSNYSLTIHFNNLDELLIFTNSYNKINIKSEMKTIRLNDKRGSKTSDLHKRAKEYKILNPSIPYRQCLIFVANNTNETINESINEPIDEIKDSETNDLIINQMV